MSRLAVISRATLAVAAVALLATASASAANPRNLRAAVVSERPATVLKAAGAFKARTAPAGRHQAFRRSSNHRVR